MCDKEEERESGSSTFPFSVFQLPKRSCEKGLHHFIPCWCLLSFQQTNALLATPEVISQQQKSLEHMKGHAFHMCVQVLTFCDGSVKKKSHSVMML